MDPTVALDQFDRAMAARDRNQITHYADALVGWLEKGGFSPVGPNGCDWRGKLSANELASHFRTVRAVAEMA